MSVQLPTKKRNWPLIIAAASLIVTVAAIVPAYFILLHRADVVYDERAVQIPLSESIRKIFEDALAHRVSDSVTVAKNGVKVSSSPLLPSNKLPDQLLYVNIRNVGNVPTAIRVRISIPGSIADEDIRGAGSAYGDIGQPNISDQEISFECPHLSNHEQALIKVSVWYQQTKEGSPRVEVEDTSEGPARIVGSVETAQFRGWQILKVILFALISILGWLIGAFVGATFSARK